MEPVLGGVGVSVLYISNNVNNMTFFGSYCLFLTVVVKFYYSGQK